MRVWVCVLRVVAQLCSPRGAHTTTHTRRLISWGGIDISNMRFRDVRDVIMDSRDLIAAGKQVEVVLERLEVVSKSGEVTYRDTEADNYTRIKLKITQPECGVVLGCPDPDGGIGAAVRAVHLEGELAMDVEPHDR